MSLGITVGKFYPFHLGHDYLIREAKKRVAHLVVLVGYQPNQTIPGSKRATWIRSMHPDVEVIEVLDDLPEAPEPWARRSLFLLNGRQPDVAFTSESYGQPWAEAMGALHIPIDPQRLQFPISGSQLRADLKTHWQMLTPPAKADLAKRVCVLGVESSGTTTLAQALAESYQTVWVPEYGRWYWEGRRYMPNAQEWDSYEFINIARGQISWEDDLATRANQLVVCDTDPLATHVWHRRYLGFYHPALEEIIASRQYDLYILTEPDFAFVQDGTRESESRRHLMHQWFREVLQKRERHFIRVAGTHEQRLEKAKNQIDSLLVFPVLKGMPPQ